MTRPYQLFAGILWLNFVLLIHAQQRGARGGTEEPNPDRPLPKGYTPAKNTQPNTGDQTANAPGALAVGHQEYIKPEDEKIDFAEIAKQVAELVTKILDIFDSTTITVTSTSTDANGSPNVFTSTRPPGFPASATGCADAQNAFALCSSSFSGFTNLPATSQAGCLCNVYPDADFNRYMGGCYNYIAPMNQTRSIYQFYATAIASGTAVCGSTYASISTPAPTGTPTTPTAPPTSTSSPSSATGRFDVGCGFSLLGGLWVFLIHALL